jgi:hypothetical protein
VLKIEIKTLDLKKDASITKLQQRESALGKLAYLLTGGQM